MKVQFWLDYCVKELCAFLKTNYDYSKRVIKLQKKIHSKPTPAKKQLVTNNINGKSPANSTGFH
jgi:hypothetical protein